MKKATMKDVARMANVTQATVSHFLNRTTPVSVETSSRIEKAIKELDYKPNANARSLKTKTTNIVGLLIPNITNGYYAEIVQAIEEELRGEGFLLFLCNTFYSRALEKKYTDTLIEQNVRGIIVGYGLTNEDCYKSILSNEIPVVTLDSRMAISKRDIPSIEINNKAGGRKAADHLAQIGAKNICFISEPLFNTALQNRYQGFHDRLDELGLSLKQEFCFLATTEYDKFEMGYNLGAHVLLLKEIDAIFTSTDQLAYGVIRRLKKGHVRIPEEIAIIGYDDNQMSKVITPELSTISQPKAEMAVKGAQKLISMILNKKYESEGFHIVLEPNLIIRESTLKLP